MKIKELKRQLEQYDDEAIVVFNTFDRGFWDVSRVRGPEFVYGNGFRYAAHQDDQYTKEYRAVIIDP